MSRWKKTVSQALWSIVFLTLFSAFVSATTLDDVSLGETWLGDPVVVEDLEGRVVVIEFWGYNCPPCRASLPHLVELQEKNKDRGLMIIGAHCQNVPQEKVVALCREKEINFPIVNGGQIAGISFSGIPKIFIFDHNGSLVFDGRPDASFDKKLEATLAEAPDWLVGEGPYVKLRSIAAKIARRQGLGSALNSLRELIESDDETERQEAQQLYERLERYGRMLLRQATALRDSDPENCLEKYREAAKKFKGDELGDEAQAALENLESDEAFQQEVAAHKLLGIMMELASELKPCSQQNPLDTAGCEKCKKKNRRELQKIAAQYARLKRSYPECQATQKAAKLVQDLGLE